MNARHHLCLCVALWITACGGTHARSAVQVDESPRLRLVAESPQQWTGIAVDANDGIWVSYPRWSEEVPISVARLGRGGEPQPFPDATWNDWKPGEDPDGQWVCVQSVVIDDQNRLWVLDTGNPRFEGVLAGGPKLVRFDLPSGEPAQIIGFEPPAITETSYLNDVRFDERHGVAYLTDSGDGALLVLDLETGQARRLLADHPSTHAEDITLEVQGIPFDRPVHADGLAYDPSEDVLFFQALRGRTLYRVSAAALRDQAFTDETLGEQVEPVAQSGASDGLLFYRGRVYISALERDSIRAFIPASGTVENLVSDTRLAWPDSFAVPPGGGPIYFTTSQVHLARATTPYRVWRLETP